MDIIDFIPVGLENAVSLNDLEGRTNRDKRTIRKLVYNARLNGELICSTCNGLRGGYYIPATPDEALPYLREQTARLRSLKNSLKVVENYVKGA